MKKLYDRILGYLPKHSRKLLLIVFLYNMFVFYFSRLLVGNHEHYVFESALDSKIPLLPFTIVIYFGCYLFWFANYILCSRYDEKQAKRFLYADLIGKTVCLVCYLFIPTTMARPEISGNDIFSILIRFLYQIDSPDNLFPSIHCFCSWMCYIGMRGDERYSKKYRIFSMVFALAVCVSTVTTKQHVLIDIPAGVLLAEGSFFLTKKCIK